MRVISGSARGLKLLSLDGLTTRPTLDRVKESMFNIIANYITDARVLDLFAGSGALGIEALSRGAKECTFVDSNKDVLDIVTKNVVKSRFEDRSNILNSDYKQFLSLKSDASYDIIFLDPPYMMGEIDNILSMIYSGKLLSKGAIVVLECDRNITFNADNYKILKKKDYGRVSIYILEAI